jgi:hypothetical protein
MKEKKVKKSSEKALKDNSDEFLYKSIVAFVRISDGQVFWKNDKGLYEKRLDVENYIPRGFTAERLSIKEFVPVFYEEQILYYSDFYKNAGTNLDYIKECPHCGMSWYNCLCSHDD